MMKLTRALLIASALALPAAAQDSAIGALPASVIFVVSTGYWEEAAANDDAPATTGAANAQAARQGYYKLSAIRQPDGKAKVYLQQMALSPSGPEPVQTVELEEFTGLGAYVTDIRPEDSNGLTNKPGLFATVYLKTSPTAAEPESWTVIIDELGDMTIEKASN